LPYPTIVNSLPLPSADNSPAASRKSSRPLDWLMKQDIAPGAQTKRSGDAGPVRPRSGSWRPSRTGRNQANNYSKLFMVKTNLV
jgi:hypothetical protein